jgi:Tol biopolymer transport system component
MGEVYRARDTRLGREVAIKVLPPSFSVDPERLQRFEQEARSAGMLNHPNVLAVYDVGTHEGAPYVVTELLEGQTLRDRQGGTALPVRKALDFAVQIAHGLAAAHEKGIVHRDLKPANLFITNDGRVKILDFGLAKLTGVEGDGEGDGATIAATVADSASPATDPGTVMGTVGYMSPEQVRGQPADHRTDLFSFGAILYEMLSAQRAFKADTAADTMSAILTKDPPELPRVGQEIPPGLKRIVGHCLEKNREERFQSARDLAFHLEAITGVSRESAVAAPVPRVRSGRSLVRIAGVLLVAAIGLAAGFLLWGRAGVSPPAEHTRLTFRRGQIQSARFLPDGRSVVYSARWGASRAQLFLKRPETADALPLDLPSARLLSVSSSGELAILLRPRIGIESSSGVGVLARAALTGGTPREIAEDVEDADWAPDGARLAVVRQREGTTRLEFPLGNVLYETAGLISWPRFSPSGDWLAFLDHPLPDDSRGVVAVVNRAGEVRRLSTFWENVHGLAWSPSGDEVWFTAAESGFAQALHAVTLSGRERLVKRALGGLVLHDVSSNGRVLLDLADIRSGVLAHASGETGERDLSWLEVSGTGDISKDGKDLLFTAAGEAFGSDYAVCLRKMDGSPPVRLGEGVALSLSPDGKWALSQRPAPDAPLTLFPTGPGEPEQLTIEGIKLWRARWFADGRRILLAGSEEGHGSRLYTCGLEGGKPRPITPEGVAARTFGGECISPDGAWVASVTPNGEPQLYPVEGGESRPIPGARSGDNPVRFRGDGRALFVAQLRGPSCEISCLDLETGERSVWRKLRPADSAGITDVYWPVLTPDGESYAYTYFRHLSVLYTVEGLK